MLLYSRNWVITRFVKWLEKRVHLLKSLFGQNDVLTIWLAILAIYLIDFSINAGKRRRSTCKGIVILTDDVVQAVDRALLVDTIPYSKQASGNAWAARMLGIGSVVGFFM